MPSTDTRFAGSIPAIYDQYFRPLLFEPYAEDLALRLRDLEEGAVLETAAGTGVVTSALIRSLSDRVQIVATDLNEAMLEVAISGTAAARVVWKQADAQKLPFGDAEFDRVVCQFGVMFFPDKLAGYREARRVLKPSGRFIFNVWGSLEDNEIARIVHQTVAAMFPENPPSFFGRVPYAYWDEALIKGELEAAGFPRVAVETVDKTTHVASAEHAAIALCQGSPLRSEIEARDPQRLSEATTRAAAAMATRFGSSSFENRMRALVVTAWHS